MFRNQTLAKPKRLSVLLTISLAVMVFVGDLYSPVIGYLASLLGSVAMIFALFMHSFWPARNKPENPVVFAVFWGVMIGGVLPMLMDTFFERGFKGVYDLLR